TRRGRSGLALAVVFATLGAGLIVAPSAGAFIYWANGGSNTIGRANVDGTGVNQNFISGGTRPCGVGVDSAHIYWGNKAGAGSIGRANLDGSGVNQNFISGVGVVDAPCGVAVDAGHIYWANSAGVNTIGRANLDGTSPVENFVG